MRLSPVSQFFAFMTLLLGYAVFLQWAGQVSIDIDEQHGAMNGRMASWVVDRHPPFAGFVGYHWAQLTGFSTVAFFSFSKLNALVALWVIYLLNRAFLPAHLALLGTAAYSASVPFVLMSQTLDNNSMLHALWPAAALFTWRSVKEGGWLNWGLAGLFIGLSLLTKYHSFLLALSLLIAVFGVFQATKRWQIWSFLGSASLALALFAPHLIAEASYGYPTFGWATASADGTTYAGPDGRVSILTFTASNALYNVFGLGVLLFIAVRKRWLRWPKPVQPNAVAEARFLIAMAILFPAAPILLSLVLGISLKATWGFNAFFLVPTLVLWMAHKASQSAFEGLRWRAFATLLPLYLLVMTGVVVANGFRDVARPLALQDAVAQADDIWAANTENPLEMVIIASEPAIAMTFYSRYHPVMKLTGATAEAGKWLLDADGCFAGPTAVIFSSPTTGWTDARGQAPRFEGLATAQGGWTNLTYTKPVSLYVLGYPDGICL